MHPTAFTVSIDLNNLGLVAHRRGDLAAAEAFNRRHSPFMRGWRRVALPLQRA